MMKPILMTKLGKAELDAELLERTTVIRPELNKRIAEARALGDLSENAEYHSARDEARKNEGRIEEIEEILKRVKIITTTSHDRVELSARVTLQKNGESEVVYTLVTPEESDIRAGKLSVESAIGRLLVGKVVGDEFTHTTPGGEVHYRVVGIE